MSYLKNETKQRILNAAIDAFARSGYRGATVREIAHQANANQAAINYHFGSKDDLYLEALRTTFHELQGGPVDSSYNNWLTCKDVPKEQRLLEFIVKLLVPTLGRSAYPAHGRLLAWEIINPSGLMDELARSEVNRQLDALGDLAAEFLPAAASAEQIRLTAIWLIGQTLSYHHARALVANTPAGSTLTLEDLARHITGLALGGLQHPPPLLNTGT